MGGREEIVHNPITGKGIRFVYHEENRVKDPEASYAFLFFKHCKRPIHEFYEMSEIEKTMTIAALEVLGEMNEMGSKELRIVNKVNKK